MPRRAHSLELVLDAPSDAAVRDRWRLLEEAGVPSLARHPGATHRPHVTVASGPRPTEEALRTAARRLGPLLPLELPVAVLALLGAPSRVTLVELVVPAGLLRTAQEELAGLWPGADDRPWLPHVTLAQRLIPGSVARALEALGGGAAGAPTQRRAVSLRWWDPDSGTVTPVTDSQP